MKRTASIYARLLREILPEEAEKRLGAALSPGAHRCAEDILVRRLEALAGPTVEWLVNARLEELDPLFSLDPRLATGEQRREAQRAVETLLEERGPRPLYGAFPLLETLLPAAAEGFVSAMEELSQRLERHRAEISRVFFDGEPLGELSEIGGAAADVHNHGRCTLRLSCGAGVFYYKPRSVTADGAYFRCVRALFPELEAAACVEGEGYGFCQAVIPAPVSTPEELDTFFHNMGVLSALAQALGAVDVHMENLLAAGTRPALIDLETLLLPRAGDLADPGHSPEEQIFPDPFLRDLSDSLYGSCLLPGLGKNETSPLYYAGDRADNLPVLDGERHTARGHEGAFFAGFRDGYRRCAAHREELAAYYSALSAAPLRYVLRPTVAYGRLLQWLTRRQGRDTAWAREALYTRLSRHFSVRGAEERCGEIVRAETESILRGDIPYFSVTGGGRDLLCGGKPVCRDFFSASALEVMERRLSRLSEDERRFEEQLSRAAMELCPSGGKALPPCPRPALPLAAQDALKEAEGCFRELAGHKISSPSGGMSWLTRGGAETSLPAGLGLYTGKAGIALFAGAMGSISQTARDTAWEIVADFLDVLALQLSWLRGGRTIPEQLLSFGLAEGVGGILRALPLISAYTGESRALELAGELLSLSPRMGVEEAKQTDVVNGLAGLLQTLLTVPDYRDSGDAAKLALRCGDALLARRTLAYKDLLLWDTLERRRPISGMGHGEAGIGHALLLAGLRFGREEYLTAAGDALRFEHEIYLPELRAWPDLRESITSRKVMHGHCYGAPGIGEAMLGCIRTGQAGAAQLTDLERAKAACVNAPVLPSDHLCCGNCSIVDFLLECGERREAGRLLAAMRETADREGWYSANRSGAARGFEASLFYGYAGIGYTMLRYCDPERFRSVLL